jgi:6-pyruvoyltetrahydropterin/6-carboxytetrahydropterin synthase
MKEITCRRRLQFAAGHRVFEHESKCAHLHGHNYVVWLYAKRAGGLDTIGRVIDFGVLKEKFLTWIDTNWDHGFIVHYADTNALGALDMVTDTQGRPQKVYRMGTNPTAENMAFHLLHDIGPGLLKGTGVQLIRVELWETENCVAEAVRDMAIEEYQVGQFAVR